MGLFSPPKKRPNQFNYIPRYYDPEKERREARRRELRGESSGDDTPYTPGKYIRTVREARAERKAQQKQRQLALRQRVRDSLRGYISSR